MNTSDIDNIMKRTERHAYEDGIGEIFWGVLFMLMGLLFFAEATVKPPIPSFSAVGLIVLCAGGFLLSRWLMPVLKGRLIFPRTGFVAYRQLKGGRRWTAMGVAALVASVIAAVVSVVASSSVGLDWVPLANGLVVGAYLLIFGVRVGLRRFQFLAGFSGLAGLAAFLAGIGPTLGAAAYFAAIGLALVVDGALALRAYLHRVPRPEEQ